MSIRWLVTGAHGLLGQEVCAALEALGETQVTPVGRSGLDVTDERAVLAAVAGYDVVVNCAAYTDADGAESDSETAFAVNATAVCHLATACARHGARLVQISTDYVMSGTGATPWAEEAPTGPVNVYGRSKALGEEAVRMLLPRHGYVVRTAWLYGEHGRNFVATMLRLAAERPWVDVVDDQWGQPTWVRPLARQVVMLARAAVAGRAPAGVYHGTATGATTWHGLARAVFELAGLDPDRVRATSSAQLGRAAARPAYSVLAHGRWTLAGLEPLGDWYRSLAEALGQPAFQDLMTRARHKAPIGV